MTDVLKRKLDAQKSEHANDNFILAKKLADLLSEKKKCESDRFANVDQFMSGNLDKDVYQTRRAELNRTAVKLEEEIGEAERRLKDSQMAADEGVADAYGKMKKYAEEGQLTQRMVQELIEKVVVTDPEHVEVVWRFSDEVMKFIMD